MISVKDSWLYCYALFVSIFLIAALSNTFEFISQHLFECEWKSTNFIASLAFLFAYIVTIFYIIFPRITKTYGRPWSLFSYLFMGIVMGLCDALVLVFSLRISLHLFPAGKIFGFLMAFFLYLSSTGYFYAVIFNPKLAPEHRDPKWDLFKILTLTFSDLIVTLFAFTYPGCLGLVFVFQALVLGGIISSMRFPDFWYKAPPLLPSVEIKQ